MKSGAGAISTSPAERSPASPPPVGDGARQQQRHPAAHRRADRDLRTPAELLEHRDALFQPAPDGAVDEGAAQFAMAGIVEPDAGAAVCHGPFIQRQRLGAPHVGIEAAEPEQPGRTACAAGRAACAGAHRDPAAAVALSHLDKGRFPLGSIAAELRMDLSLPPAALSASSACPVKQRLAFDLRIGLPRYICRT